ncbi:MAG: DUF1800 family protein, partial [Bacteroidota bacterium]
MQRRSFLRRVTGQAPAPASPPGHAAALHALQTEDNVLPYNQGLAPYVPDDTFVPWNEQRVLHLLRRTGYRITVERVYDLLAMPPADAVDALVDAAVAAPMPARPSYYDFPYGQGHPDFPVVQGYRDVVKFSYRQALELDAPGTGLRERMVMALSNLLVVEYRANQRPSVLYRYVERLRTHALGNLRTLITEIGRDDPAMVLYLNSHRNEVSAPNENYARELLELFTMGPIGPDGTPNYTETDIQELARALTGWRARINEDAIDTRFLAGRFDDGEKTIFGRTGNWGYDDALAIVFEERGPQIAHYLSRRLYQAFVCDVASEAVVAEMAAVMLANDFEVVPVLRVLLKSRHFLDTDAFGVRYRSPFDLFVSFYGSRDITDDEFLNNLHALVFQLAPPFNPPDVSGWPSGRAWIDTASLDVRVDSLSRIASWSAGRYKVLGRSMPTPDDPYILAEELAIFFTPVPFDRETLAIGTEVLLGGSQDYMWSIDNPSA